MTFGLIVALVLSLLAGWMWNERSSYTHWSEADRVVEAGRRGEYFLGEKGGRAPTAVRAYERASARTMAVVWGLFFVAAAGHAVERVIRREPILGPGEWGFTAAAVFMVLTTFAWAAVTFT